MRSSADIVARVRRVTVVGMVVNVVIAALKGVGGWCFASQALVADAVHSVSDLVTDVAVLLGVRYWAAPADEDHPYGHGKIEALVTLFIAVALLLVAFELGRDALAGLVRGETRPPRGLLAFFIALASVILKEGLYRWTHRVACAVNSPALEANAWHHRSDALSSIPVAIALAVAWLVPALAWVDAAGALLVACFIVRVSWQLAKPALQELVDAGMDDKAAEVERVARGVVGVRGVHQTRARRYGAFFQADLHVQVDPSLSVSQGHDIGHRVKEAIRAAGIEVSDAIVHVEPDES